MIDADMTQTLIFGHLWQSVALAAVLAGALILGRRMHGTTRYNLAALALVASIVLPLAAFIPGESLARTVLDKLNAPAPMAEKPTPPPVPGPSLIEQAAADIGAALHVGNDVELDRRVGIVVVDGRRDDAFADGHQRKHRLDGAGRWGRFRYVTLPLLKPIIFIVTMFSVIFTFADFQLIYVLTRGGPASSTHVFATYAFDIAMGAGQFGQGASIALAMVPALALIILAMAIYMRPSKS